MAEIAQYTSSDALRGLQVSDKGADAYEREGRSVGNDIRQIGGEFQKNLDLYDQHQTMQETSDLTNQFVSVDAKIEQAKQDALAKNQSPSDFADSVSSMLDPLENTATTDRAKEYYSQKRAQVLTEAAKSYTSQYGAMAGQNLENSLQNTTDSAAKKALASPTDTGGAIAGAKLDIETAMANSDAKLSPQQRANATKGVAEKISDAGAEGMLTKIESGEIPAANAGKVRDMLLDPNGDFYPNMSVGKLSEITQRLAKVRDTSEGTAQIIAAQVLPKYISGVVTTNGGYDAPAKGQTVGQGQTLIDNYPTRTPEQQEKKAELQRALDDGIAAGKATRGAMSLPQDDLKNTLQTLRQKRDAASPEEAPALDSALDAAQKASNTRDEAFKKDPAGWLTDPNNNPTVSNAYNAWKANANAQTLNAFVTKSQGEQARLYPNQVPAVLTGEMKSHIADQIAQAKTTDGGAATAATVLQANAQMFGPRWSQAAQELHHAGVLSDTLFLAASLGGNPQTAGLSTRLVQAAFQDPKELQANSGTSEEKTLAAASAALKPLRQSLSDSVSGQETVSGYEKGLGRLLLSMSKDAGSDQTGQNVKLAQQMVLNQYKFVPNNGGMARVPVKYGLTEDAVSNAMSGYNLDIHKLIAPPSYSGLGPQDQAITYRDSLKDHGRWITNGDETGIRLVDFSGNAVNENRNGKAIPVEIKFSDMKAHPAAVVPTSSGIANAIWDATGKF